MNLVVKIPSINYMISLRNFSALFGKNTNNLILSWTSIKIPVVLSKETSEWKICICANLNSLSIIKNSWWFQRNTASWLPKQGKIFEASLQIHWRREATMFWRTWMRNSCFFKSRAKSLLTCDKENSIDALETAQEEAGTNLMLHIIITLRVHDQLM